MRLRRLDLTRYGKFTDQAIDFGEAAPGAPDLHIVYGLNEAGKSTAFSAYLDLLFGVPERSTYNFLHAYNAMQIGGVLEIGGVSHELTRLKQRTNALLHERGQPVNEALLTSALGGLTRESYRTMFSLDERSLRDGGAAILESKGDLGELLFSASAGLADVSRTLNLVSEEALQFHRKRARNTQLAELKQSLATLKTEREAIDTYASTFAGLVAAQAQAQKAYDEVLADLASAKARHERLSAILRALPVATELARTDAALQQYVGLPRPPRDWGALVTELMRDETRLQTQATSLDATLERLQQDADEITVDERVLAQSARIAALEDGRARYRTAENDLPKRRLALAEQAALLTNLLKTLGRSDDLEPAALVLPAVVTASLRDLIERRSGIEATLRTTEREVERVRVALDDAESNAARLGGDAIGPGILKRLESQLARLQQGERQARLSLETKRLADIEQDLARSLQSLSPWQGSPDQLARLHLPEASQMESWRGQAADLTRRLDRHAERHRELESRRIELDARLALLRHGDESIDDDAASQSRTERDRLWLAHKTALSADTAEQFETALHRDDRIGEARLSRANDLADWRKAQEERQLLLSSIERERALRAEAEAELATLRQTVHASAPAGLTDPEQDAACQIATLETWLARRVEALRLSAEVKAGKRAQAALSAELDTELSDLRLTLSDMGNAVPEDFDARRLLSRAADTLAEAQARTAERSGLAARLADLKREMAERERDFDAARKDDAAWKTAWETTLSRTWFADQTDVAGVRALLDALSDLPSILREEEQLRQRITMMERDRSAFATEVGGILEALGEVPDKARVLEAAESLTARAIEAERSRHQRRSKDADLAKLREERQQLSAKLAEHTQRKAELTAFFDVESLTEVAERLEQSADRDRLERRAEDMREQILRELRVDTLDAASEVLDAVDAEAAERDAAELVERIDNLSERTRVLFAELTRAKDRLDAVGGDNAVARIEARRATILMEIEHLAVRHLKLRAGALAAETALALYREKHRSTMMARASEAFRQMTRGDYSGLAARPEKDREILIGVARDGASKLSDAMSTGTRYQLYLALRLAGYEEFAAVRPAVPFVADDIMETFDELRSEEVFRLFGKMAGLGQVIYLTHHRHLCDIAKSVVPEARIHEL